MGRQEGARRRPRCVRRGEERIQHRRAARCGGRAVASRSLSFGGEAERYERARPTYPEQLVDRLLVERPRRVLDIACGTGKAALPFVASGCDVVGVEADGRMAAIARRHGLTVEVVAFEDWDPQARTFDLAICGQAWHWLEPERRVAKAAEALREGGRLAAFWNFATPEEPLLTEMDAVYAHFAPELTSAFVALGLHDAERNADAAQLECSGRFARVERWTFTHEQTYTTAQWLDLLRTHSDHIALPRERLDPLLESVGRAIDRHGGSLRLVYRTHTVTAVRT